MEACALNNLDVIIQKTISPRKSEEDVMIKLVSGLFPQRKIAPRLGLEFGLGLGLVLGLGGNFPRGQLSKNRLSFVNPRKDRSNRSQMFFNIRVFQNLRNFTGKHMCWSLFLKKLQAL